MQSLKICSSKTTEQNHFADDDHVIRSKAPEQLLNEAWGVIILSNYGCVFSWHFVLHDNKVRKMLKKWCFLYKHIKIFFFNKEM